MARFLKYAAVFIAWTLVSALAFTIIGDVLGIPYYYRYPGASLNKAQGAVSAAFVILMMARWERTTP